TTTLANVPRRHSVASTADSATFVPVIYPAMLSMVAEAFRNKVPLGNRVKDSLDYNDCFVGREAVDTIAYLIKSTDRNLSLLLGRALDAQKFFHDVTYNHRLRDSSNELYKFQAPVATGSNGELARPAADADPEDGGLPNGVFTLLTDCYSPTCTRDRLCYSIACPRRLEQQTRLLSSTTSQLQRSPSRVSMTELDKKHALWSTSVSKEIVESVSDNERKRQEVIFETIQTEREFVADLDIIERVFVEPLRRSDIIPAERLDIFIEEVFFNINELHAINSRLLTKLIARQKEGSIVDKIGDIFVSVVDEFEAYVRYGGQQVLAKYALDQEKATNPEFAKFLQECERVPECRKLPIQSFLARPTTRIGRYPLLLKSAMTAAADHHPDRTLLPQAMHVIKEVLTNINREAGRAENQLKLEQLQMSLVFNPGEVMDLGLNRPETLIVREGHLILRKNAGSEIDLQVFLFDHMLLLTKVKKAGLHKVYKRPIPLEFLVIGENHNNASRRANTVSGSPLPAVIPAPTSGFPFTILHLGRDGGSYTLYAANQAERRTWRDVIEQQKALLTDRRKRFELASVCESYFPAHNRVNSSTVYKDQLLLGTDMGLFVGPLNPFASSTEESVESASPDAGSLAGFRKVVDLEKISQVDVLPDHNMITLLAERALWTYPLDVLNEAQSPSAGVTAAGTSVASSAIAARAKGEKISAHLNFYKNGVCKDRTFISGVRLTALNSTVKIYEPVGAGEVKRRGKIGKFFAGAETSVKTFKEFYIPAEASSIHYLRTKLCVGCSKGFEVVDLETLMPQGLIDAEDDRMDFVNKREGLKPISIFRLGSGDFLLCYNEFGFYIDRFGSRTKGDALIQWAGYPTSFTFSSPYIIAYEPSFIEIRNVETTLLQQIIPTANLRTLNSETRHVVVDALHAPDMQNVCRLVQVENTSSPTTEGGETEKYKQAHRSNGKVEDDNSSVNSDLPPYSF
ncbi:CNH domain-containing protein, partial [Powellomyces hirtus]